jgi:hypothetical protein
MTEQRKDDAMLEQYLEGKSHLSGEYQKQEKLQPSAELDDLILSAAEDEISKQEKKSKHNRNNWLIPTSIAATLVLSFSLIQLQKPTVLYQEEKVMDMAAASIADKPQPAEQRLQKKKQRAKAESFAGTPHPEERQTEQLALADRGAPATAPLASEPPAMVASGVLMESTPTLLNEQDAVKRSASKADAKIVLSKAKWLEKIKALLKDNKIDEAKKEFERFAKAYPEFVPDTDLKQQLGLGP